MHTMKAVSDPRLDLEQFLEVVIMWHTSGDVPMNRVDTTEFIEDEGRFANFLLSVQFMANEFGLEQPTRSQIVRTLYRLYEEEAA